MIRDEKSLIFNQKKLKKIVQSEIDFAHNLDRKEGLVYVFTSNYEKSCSNCKELLDGKIFLLYDGRNQTQYEVPQVPNPFCIQTIKYEDEKECGFAWFQINPLMQYLKKEKQYFRNCNEYLDVWDMKMRATNEQEWEEWYSYNSQIELYKPPFVWESIVLNTNEKSLLKSGKIKINYDGFDLTLKEVGLIELLSSMDTVNMVGAGFGLKLPDYGVDFSEFYDNCENLGKQIIETMIKKNRFKLSGGSLYKSFEGSINNNSSFIEIRTNIGLTKKLMTTILGLSKSDIKLISQNGF